MMIQRLLALLLAGTALHTPLHAPLRAQAFDDPRAGYDRAYGDDRPDDRYDDRPDDGFGDDYDNRGAYDDGATGFAVQPGDLFGGQNVRDTREFIGPLEPYGDWVQSRFGLAFRPNVEDDWRPYTNGRWAEDRLWISDDPWGWATDHYGRWGFDQRLGWVWVPGREWAPSWVAWREADDITGWAPIPPGIAYSYNTGFGAGFGFDNFNSWYAPSWVWVPRAYVYQPRFGGRILRAGSGVNYWRGTRFNYRSTWNGRPGYARPNFARPNFARADVGRRNPRRPDFSRPNIDRRGYPLPGTVRPGYGRGDDRYGNRRDSLRGDPRNRRDDDRRDNDRRRYDAPRGGTVGTAIGGGLAGVSAVQPPRGLGGRPGSNRFQRGGPQGTATLPPTAQRPAAEGRPLRQDFRQDQRQELREARREARRDAMTSPAGVAPVVQPRAPRQDRAAAQPPAMAVNPQSIPAPRSQARAERVEQRQERRAERAAGRGDRPGGGQRRSFGDGANMRPQ